MVRLPNMLLSVAPAMLLLASAVRSFDILGQSSACDQLFVRLNVSASEVNATTGMVVQFSYSRNVSDASLYNTSVPWTAFRSDVRTTSLDRASFFPPSQYSFNQSLDASMNATWNVPLPAPLAHIFVWLYVDGFTAPRGPLSPSPDIATIDASPYCNLYFYDNGTRTGYNPYVSTSSSSSSSNNGEHGSSTRSLALGLGIGIGLFAVIAITALLCTLDGRRKGRKCTPTNDDEVHVERSINGDDETPKYEEEGRSAAAAAAARSAPAIGQSRSDVPPPTYGEATRGFFD